MGVFVVLEQKPAANPAGTVFVRDEFSIIALAFPVIWLIWHRLWFAAVMILLVTIGVALVGQAASAPVSAVFASLVLGLYVALEGPEWRVARYRRSGYAESGTIDAASLYEAEFRWFSKHRDRQKFASAPVKILRAQIRSAGAEAPGSDMLFGFDGEAGR